MKKITYRIKPVTSQIQISHRNGKVKYTSKAV